MRTDPDSSPPTAGSPASDRAIRVLQFVLLAALVIAAEQIVEVWLLPGPSAELAVAQLEPSDAAADSLRLFETLRGFLPTLSAVVILVIALVLFVPGFKARVRRFIDRGGG